MEDPAPPSPTTVTLRTIADRAQVSCTTVSLALRNHPKISPATRKRIRSLARRLGYRMNPLVSAHMSYLRALHPKYTGVCLAFVCNRPLPEIEADTKTPILDFFRSAKDRAGSLGYELRYFNLAEDGMTARRLSQILTARGIRGLILAPLSTGGGAMGVDLDWKAYASVMIEHAFVEPRLHKVCNDEFSTIGRLIQRLVDTGHRRVGIAMAREMDEHANHFWLAGFQAFQALIGRENRVPHFIVPKWTQSSFLRWYRTWRPDAIITINDDIVGWLESAGVAIPGDVSCATLYWKKDRPDLSGFYQNHELMAASAVDLLVAQLNRNEVGLPIGETTLLIQAVWKQGRTLARRSAAGTQPVHVWTR
jgi:LacI family transcriptional regulator, galactose operon repressor